MINRPFRLREDCENNYNLQFSLGLYCIGGIKTNTRKIN